MTFVIALLMAFVVNVDTIRIGTPLSGQPALIDKLKLTSIPPSSPPTSVEDAVRSGEQVMAAIDKMAQDGFPVGWAPGHFLDIRDDKGNWEPLWAAPASIWYRPFLGWFITAVAALFGAPFWFDALQSVVRLKGSWPSPAEKATNRAASS
jgi:hypothetical protein